MKYSNTELIVERYYRLKKWLVEKDVPILPQEGKRHWGDLDILAVGEEVHLISCKDFLPNNKDIDKVIKNLEDSEKYIKKEYKHLSAKAFRKIYVYGTTGKDAVKKARDKEIETFELKEIFVRYVKTLDEYLANMNIGRKDIPKGKRYYIIGELEGLDKFISFLLNNNFLNDSTINELLRKIEGEEISKLK
jgi:hypothetical protein